MLLANFSYVFFIVKKKERERKQNYGASQRGKVRYSALAGAMLGATAVTATAATTAATTAASAAATVSVGTLVALCATVARTAVDCRVPI